MTVEKDAGETCSEVIHHILGSGDMFQTNEVVYNTITDCNASNIHVASACGGSASVCHGSITIIVFVYHRHHGLWAAKAIENAMDV